MATRHVTVENFKAWSRIKTWEDDYEVESALIAAEQSLDDALGRRIVLAGATPVTRVYVPADDTVTLIDDFASISSITNGGATITSYQLEPLNGLSAGGESVPYDCVRLTAGSWYRNGQQATVSITGIPGWPALPAGLPEVVKVLAKAVLDGRNIRLGIVDMAADGAVTERDAMLVRNFVRDHRGWRSHGMA